MMNELTNELRQSMKVILDALYNASGSSDGWSDDLCAAVVSASAIVDPDPEHERLAAERHIYHVGSEWVVAHTSEQARDIVRGMIGDEVDLPDYEPDQWPDNEPFTVFNTDEPGHPKERMLPAQWFRKYGCGSIANDWA